MTKKSLTNRRSFFWVAVLCSVLVCLGGTILFRHYYQRQLWDPETAALVNGRPIYREALEEMMQAGLNPRQTNHPQGAALTIRQILDRLISEELISQEAQKAGLDIPQAQVAEFVDSVRLSWPCQASSKDPICKPPPDLGTEPFLKAVRQRQILEKMAQKVIPAELRYNKRDWRKFWVNWLARMPLGEIYQVKVLFIQDSPGVEELLKAKWKSTMTAEELEVLVRLEGFTTLISRVMSLNPRAQAIRDIFGPNDLLTELSEIKNSPPYLVRALKLPHSWAVVEVRDIKPAPDPDRLAAAARAAYERQVGQEAFGRWVINLRQKAEIVINPNFTDLEEKPQN